MFLAQSLGQEIPERTGRNAEFKTTYVEGYEELDGPDPFEVEA